MPGTTGDIVWNWRDPKTVELYNTDRGATTGGPSPELGAVDLPFGGAQQSEQERQAMQRMMEEQMRADAGAQSPESQFRMPTPREKKYWKNEIKKFDRYLRHDGQHVEDGIDALLQKGALWADPDNIGNWSTSVPITNQQIKTLGEGLNRWQEQVQRGDPYYAESWKKAQDQWRELYRRYEVVE